MEERLVMAGPRGVTRHQMIPAIRENVDKPENILKLYQKYPETFMGSLKYIPKGEKALIMPVIEENHEISPINEEKMLLEQRLRPARKGITYHQIIPALERASEDKNFKEIQLIKKYYPEKFQGSMKYIAKRYMPNIEQALSEE
jgi:hypothetical protein